MIALFGLMGLIMYPTITFVKNCVTSDATAAPYIPIRGISMTFMITFAEAPEMLIIHR